MSTEQRIFDKLDEHGQRIARVEECVKAHAKANGAMTEQNAKAHARVEAAIGKLDERLSAHLDAEDANMNQMRTDLHYLRGVVEERARHRAKNPLLRLVLWIFSLFGIRPG